MSRALVGARERWKQGDLADSALVGARQRRPAMIQVVLQVSLLQRTLRLRRIRTRREPSASAGRVALRCGHAGRGPPEHVRPDVSSNTIGSLRICRPYGLQPMRPIGVTPRLYHNLYHRPPALASAHERRIDEIPLFPALTSAHERPTHI